MSCLLDIAVVADDLTGAADAGVQFCPYLGPMYMTGAEHIGLDPVDIQSKGITVFTNTRSIEPARAADTVYRTAKAIKRLNPNVVYKKIDSGLRGNLGQELDAMVSALHSTASFVSPALPEQGRTTIGDCHQINGIPVNETEMGRDPLCPVNESRLSVLLSTQSQMPVGHIHLNFLEAGIDSLSEQVTRLLVKGCRHIVFDAQKTLHLDTIATLSRERFDNILLVGSAGLAHSLARTMALKPVPLLSANTHEMNFTTQHESHVNGDRQRWCQTSSQAVDCCDNISPDPLFFHGSQDVHINRPQLKKWLFVCGSASQVLADQALMLAKSEGWSRVIIDPAVLAADHTLRAKKSLLSRLKTIWLTGNLIISIAPLLDTQAAVKPDRLILGLADAASSLMSLAVPDGLFLSGGDTAEKVLHKTNGSALLLLEEILPGIMRGEIANGPLKGLPVFTKPGAFGQPDTLIQLLHSMNTGKNNADI